MSIGRHPLRMNVEEGTSVDEGETSAICPGEGMTPHIYFEVGLHTTITITVWHLKCGI